tara:strand:- start:3983 stop:6175 length:2193 start_codon:yes stop_codon:yes gene_type:complete
MKFISHLIILLSMSFCLLGQNYLWPTNASNTITAFFAEERPRRYHAGIDIRTYGKIGFETYAIEDGYIEKILIDYKGYGKTLYLRLNDGNLAVYAHLDKFSPEVDNLIDILKKDYNKQVFTHHFDKQEIVVKKGEIVGYTGDTGTISGPHLHFEIRDKNNICLNPLNEFYNLEDDIAPIPKKIAFVPKSKNTLIDGFTDIMQYDIIKNNETEYMISDTISVVGEFGISLNIEDKVNKQPFNYGLYNLELYIDGEIKYKVEYNKHDFSDGPLVLKERNYNLKRTINERFYNLYNNTPSLSFIDKRSWPSYNLEPGIHNIIIKANDINDNKIIIFGTISANDNKDIILNFTETKEDIIIKIDELSTIRDYKIELCNKYDSKPIDSFITNDKLITINKNQLNDPFNVIKISGKSIDGVNSKKYYYKSKKLNPIIKGDFKIKNFEHGCLIQFVENEFSNETASINLIKIDTTLNFPLKRINQNILTTDIIDFNDLDNIKFLQVSFNSNPAFSFKKNLNSKLFYPNEGLFIKMNDFVIDENKNFINDTTLFWIIEKEINKKNKLDFKSNIYELNPTTVILNSPLNIHFESKQNDVGIGIYFYDSKKDKWNYLKTTYANQRYSTSVLSNEIFALIKDKEIPIISNLIPNVNSTYKFQDLDMLSFNIMDDLSGITDIKNIEVKIDSEVILFDYIPYRNLVQYKFSEDLLEGEHTIEINAKDNVGNTATIKGSFRINE